MSTLFVDSAESAALWIVIKASALLCVAVLVQLTFLRRASAATRHIVWTIALLSVLLLPVVSSVLPRWSVVVHSTTTIAGPAPAASDVHPIADIPGAPAQGLSGVSGPDAPRVARLSPTAAIVVIYLTGAIALLIRMMAQRWTLRRFARRATIIRDDDWVRLLTDCARRLRVGRSVGLLRSLERSVPMAFGTRRPSIVLPAIADMWDDDRRRAVVLHELAHVARYDCLTHTLAVVACALYWFHPGVWWIARRVRIERELACDDCVIAAGTEARQYAGHLLEIAYSFGGHRAHALAVTLARPRQLEGRMLAALDARRNRDVPSIRVCLAGAAIAVVVLAALAGARLTATAATPAAALPAVAQTAWPVSNDVPTFPSNPKDAATELKEIARLPMRGLQDARSRLSRIGAVVGLNQDQLPGTWEVRPTETKGTVHLRLVEVNSSTGSNVPIDQLEGLTAAQLAGPGGPVQFRVRRDAGTFTFEGVIRNGVGAGTFSFTPDANFPGELAKRGFDRPTAAEQYQMARHDVGFAFLDELNRQGYVKPKTSDLVRAGQHGVQATYLRDMGALGYRLGSLDPLITLRDHGITPDYVRELAGLGYKGMPADDLRQARDHGITPDYVRGMREAGYGSLPMNELIKVRDHGITPQFGRELGNAGYAKLPLDQLVRVRDHGVSPEYAAEMRKLGFSLSIDDLIRTRDHGISVEFVRDMAALGYGGQTMDSLIRVRDHGVTPQYARDVKALGYDKLALEDLIALRDHGLTADRIRAANARAGTRLPIDMLKSLAAGGMR
jgi:beta-lactamase regulating signal transducer with metallopeptidase domain